MRRFVVPVAILTVASLIARGWLAPLLADDFAQVGGEAAASEAGSERPRLPLPSRETGGAIVVGPVEGTQDVESLRREFVETAEKNAQTMSREELTRALQEMRSLQVRFELRRLAEPLHEFAGEHQGTTPALRAKAAAFILEDDDQKVLEEVVHLIGPRAQRAPGYTR